MNIPVRHQHRYRVCGLDIGSAVPFPELQAESRAMHECAPDVEFEMGGDLSARDQGNIILSSEEPDGTPWLSCSKSDEGYRFHYPGYADFLVDRLGRQVNCVAGSETAPETIRHLFLDHIIPPLLNLRGKDALHASAVRIPGGACAFIGPSGAGKSTLAAAFHVAGFPVLCDDCLVVKDDSDRVSVVPAYPGLRLCDDSRGAFFASAQSTLPVSHYTSKRRISTPDLCAEGIACFPLLGVYSLRRHEDSECSTDPLIEPLSARDAFMELVEFAFRLDPSDRPMILRQMRALERVAIEVSVKRLCLPDELGALSAAREMILRDLGQN